METRCDGVDNDCDQLVDVLLPAEENRCQTGLPGACGQGYAACSQGVRVCLAPPPVAETIGGADHDCNGQVDDVPAVTIPGCRARVLIPPYLWLEAPKLADEVAFTLEQAGIPFDVDKHQGDWAAGFGELQSYRLVIVPGYVVPGAIEAPQREALLRFVEGGGVVILNKLLGAKQSQALFDAAGIMAAEKRLDVSEIHLAPVPATLYFDSLEETVLPLAAPGRTPGEVVLYQPNASVGAEPFGTAVVNGAEVGTPFVRRTLGKGAIYTLGRSFSGSGYQRCYVNCFDPSDDLAGLFLRGALREACRGHYGIKHTVPGTQPSVLTVSHDVDAPDSHNTGTWGDPGAIQMAKMEQSLGVRGTNFVTTDFVAGYFNRAMVEGLCTLGMCPEGAHSVQHLYMSKMARGDCSVTEASYDPATPSVCGEVRVSMEILRGLVLPDTPLRAWRTPYLDVPPDLFQILHDQGVLYDSSLALGDMHTNLPIALSRYPRQEDWFRRLAMFEIPINLEDGIGWYENGQEQRVELQASNQPKFLSLWSYAMLQNRANSGWTVLLVHPSYGRGVGPENLPIKISSVEKIVRLAQRSGLLVEPMTSLGDFWRGRDNVVLRVGYSDDRGYFGTLTTGPIPAPRFSLEFGDDLRSFSCKGAGPATIEKNRVVFETPLPPSATLEFEAQVR